MVDIIDEIKEDLRHERLTKLWKQFGVWIIGAALLVVLGTAGNVWWRSHVASKQAELSNQYYNAIELLQRDKSGEAIELLETLKKTDDSVYPALAGFTQASNLLQEGKYREAAMVYQSIADKTSVDNALRGLAELHVVNLQIEHKMADSKVIELELANLIQPGNVWRFSALELQASHALAQGYKVKALEIFKSISKAPLAPGNIKDRAAEMIEALHQYNTPEGQYNTPEETNEKAE